MPSWIQVAIFVCVFYSSFQHGEANFSGTVAPHWVWNEDNFLILHCAGKIIFLFIVSGKQFTQRRSGWEGVAWVVTYGRTSDGYKTWPRHKPGKLWHLYLTLLWYKRNNGYQVVSTNCGFPRACWNGGSIFLYQRQLKSLNYFPLCHNHYAPMEFENYFLINLHYVQTKSYVHAWSYVTWRLYVTMYR